MATEQEPVSRIEVLTQRLENLQDVIHDLLSLLEEQSGTCHRRFAKMREDMSVHDPS